MKKVLISAAAASMLALAAVPAAAQPYGGYAHGDRPDRVIERDVRSYDRSVMTADDVESRIARAVRRHQVTPRQAQSLLADLALVKREAWVARRDGRVDRYERVSINRSLLSIHNDLQRMIHNQDRADGYGHYYDDRNGSRYDDRFDDRYGRDRHDRR